MRSDDTQQQQEQQQLHTVLAEATTASHAVPHAGEETRVALGDRVGNPRMYIEREMEARFGCWWREGARAGEARGERREIGSDPERVPLLSLI